MKHISEYIKESLINEVSAGLLTRAAKKAKSMQGAKYKRLAKEFEKWRDSHKREDQIVQQAVQQATKGNKPKPITPTSKAVLIDLIISSLENDITDLNYIDTSKITDMSYLFSSIANNDDLHKNIDKSLFEKIDISKWNVSNVTNMGEMFVDASFNGDISEWDVSKVENMECMFFNSKFDGDISKWNVSNVTDMEWMFARSKFNQDISSWDVSNVEKMNSMFAYSKFNQDISKWDVRNVKIMNDMFYYSKFNQDISSWDVSNVKDMREIFDNSPLKGKEKEWWGKTK